MSMVCCPFCKAGIKVISFWGPEVTLKVHVKRCVLTKKRKKR